MITKNYAAFGLITYLARLLSHATVTAFKNEQLYDTN